MEKSINSTYFHGDNKMNDISFDTDWTVTFNNSAPSSVTYFSTQPVPRIMVPNTGSGLVTLAVCTGMLALCLVGLYGNFISIIIFTQPIMRSSINVLLTALSAIDFCILSMSIPVLIVPGFNVYQELPLWQSFCYPFVVKFLYPVLMIAQSSSVWTFVIISVERYLAVCHPFRVRKMMSTSRAKLCQCLVVVFSIFYNLIRFWEYDIDFSTQRGLKENLRTDFYYFTLYFAALYIATHFALPFLAILVLNVKIVRAIKRAHSERRRLNSRQTMEYRTAQMVIVVTTMFGFCNITALVLNVWEANEVELFKQNAFIAYLLMDISNVLIILNSASTFLIYLFYCHRYCLFFKRFNRFCCLRSCCCCPNMLRKLVAKPAAPDWTDEFALVELNEITCSSTSGTYLKQNSVTNFI